MTNVHNVGFLGIINRNRHFDGGRGTTTNPYRIVKIRHFNNMRRYPTNTHYRLENDVVFTDEFEEDGEYYNNGALWLPIPSFSGSIDGQGYKIENLKSIFSTNYRGALCNYAGSNTTIKNIYFKNINIDRTSTSIAHSGTVVAQGTSTLLIEGVFVDGFFRTGLRSGGIMGRIGKVRRCATNLNHIVSEVSGGLIYDCSFNFVEDCYTRGNLSNAPNHIAGIHGSTFGARLRRCYTAQALSGSNFLRRGLISFYDSGNPDGESYDCFWDMDVTNATLTVNNGTGLTVGLTTIESKYPYPAYNASGDTAYSMWDFDNVWAHDVDGTINNGYPYLRNVTPIPDP